MYIYFISIILYCTNIVMLHKFANVNAEYSYKNLLLLENITTITNSKHKIE